MSRNTYRCSACGQQGHNKATCPRNRSAPSNFETERMIRMMAPTWVAASERLTAAAERVQSLITPELTAAWSEQQAAMQASNEVGLTMDSMIRQLSDERAAEVFQALRERGFEGLFETLGMTKEATS